MHAELPGGTTARTHESSLRRDARRRRGVFYTPAQVASRLVRLALEELDAPRRRRPTICDPAAGGGAFLVAAAEQLATAGLDRQLIVAELLWGADIDRRALTIARSTLLDWAGAPRGSAAELALERHLVAADPLVDGPSVWPDRPLGGFDVVVGNPPFLNQLGRRTARSVADLHRLRARMGQVVAPYTDAAALFLAESVAIAAPGGAVVLVLPESALAARDARAARAQVAHHTAVTGCWTGVDRIFDATVDVCAPVLAIDRPQPYTVRRWAGASFEPASPLELDARQRGELLDGTGWSRLIVAGASADVPDVHLDAAVGVVGDVASATAGFRDQFYGLHGQVVELRPAAGGTADARRRPPLLTAGAIDPLRPRWGRAPIRFGGDTWEAPAVDLSRLERADPKLARWGRARLVPKVVLATQTRVLEPVVDLDGSWWPSVPTIAVAPNGSATAADLWRLAAVLVAPPVAAWALTRHRGAALARDAIKLSAHQVGEIPLPSDVEAWARGAASAASAQAASAAGDALGWHQHLLDAGRAMTEAYGAPDEVLAWWTARLPGWR